MTTWKNLELGGLVSVLQQLSDKAAPALQTAASAAQAAAALAQALANLMPGADPLGPVIESMLDALLNNSVSVLPFLPNHTEKRRGWSGFVSVLSDSLQDRSDPMRPQFGPADPVGAIVVMGHAESFDDVLELMKALSLLTDMRLPAEPVAERLPAPRSLVASGIVTQPGATATLFQDGSLRGMAPILTGKAIEFVTGPARDARRLVGDFDSKNGFVTVSPGLPAPPRQFDAYTISHPGTPAPPDWNRLRLADLARPVRQGVAAARRAARSLQTPGPGPALVQAIAARSKHLSDVAKQLTELADGLKNLPTDGMSLVVIPPLPGGVDGLLTRLEAAEGRPVVSASDYVTGVTLLYGSAAVGTAAAFVVG